MAGRDETRARTESPVSTSRMSAGMPRFRSIHQTAASARLWGTASTHPETSVRASTPLVKTSMAGSITMASGEGAGAAAAAAEAVPKRARSLYMILYLCVRGVSAWARVGGV